MLTTALEVGLNSPDRLTQGSVYSSVLTGNYSLNIVKHRVGRAIYASNPSIGRLRQEGRLKFEISQGYIVNLRLRPA